MSLITSGKTFETRFVRMEALWLVQFQAPPEDVGRIMSSVAQVASLTIGNYDCCAFQSAGGVEHYRPGEGAAVGAEEGVRHRPDVVEVSFQIAREPALLDQTIEAIFAVHSYEEPTIIVHEILASRSKSIDDRNNPHRWWNKGGDWK